MLKIIVNNQEVDLGSLQAVTLKYNGGIFDFDKTLGSYTIPFTLALNDINGPIFDFPYRVGNIDNDVREYDAELWHSGLKILDGTITAKIFAKKAGISCNLSTDNGKLYKKLNEKTLNNHNYGGAKPFTFKEEYSFDDDDYLLYAVENENFADGTAWETEWQAGTFFLKSQQNQYLDIGGTHLFFNPSAGPVGITPFPLLWRTLKYLFENLGFLYTDGFFDQGDYKTLNIFNVNNSVIPDQYIDGSDIKTNNLYTTVDIANHLPAMPSADFVFAIQNFFNVFFHTTNTNIKVVDRLAMVNSSVFKDITYKIRSDYKKTIVDYNPSGASVQVQADENDLNTKDYIDLNQFPSPEHVDTDIYSADTNEIVYDEILVIYRKFANQFEVTGSGGTDIWRWFNFPTNFTRPDEPRGYLLQSPWLIGDKEFEVDARLAAVPNYILARVDNSFQYRLPKVQQPGNSYVNTETNPFTLRLMYYQGLKEAEEDSLHGGGGNTILQPLGTDWINSGSEYKEISARWSYGDRWQAFIEKYVEMAKVEYEQDLQFSAGEIKNFDFSEKKLVDGNLFFIKSFSVQFTRDIIKPAKCLMLKSD